MRSGPPTPTMGIEAEFLGWQRGVGPVVDQLYESGYTLLDYEEEHGYHCDCGTCFAIGSAGVLVPVKWKRQHDASLTIQGTEWISSPFPVIGAFVEQVLDAIKIMSEGDETSELQGRFENRRMDGLNAEAGLHVHCQNRSNFDPNMVREFVRVMRGYAPEIYMLTVPTDLFRSYRYRQLSSNEGGRGHRTFLNVVADSRLEWRMFEPAYNVPFYMEAVIAICSSLTAVMNYDNLMSALDSIQAYHPWGNWSKTDEIESRDDVIERFNPVRAVALLTAMKSVVFDTDITETAVTYCEEAWEL